MDGWTNEWMNESMENWMWPHAARTICKHGLSELIPTTVTVAFLCTGLPTCDWITQNTFLSLDLSRQLRKHHLVFLGKALEEKKPTPSPSHLACRQSHPVSAAVCRSTRRTSWPSDPVLPPPNVQGHSRSCRQAGRWPAGSPLRLPSVSEK